MNRDTKQKNKDMNYISNTGITFKITEDWFTNKVESEQRSIMAEICKLLSENNVDNELKKIISKDSFEYTSKRKLNSSEIQKY